MHIHEPHAWGGRQGRYAESSDAQHRSFDPFGRQNIVFARAYEYEAWIRARFDPNTLKLTHKPTEVKTRGDARVKVAKATFVVTGRDGVTSYHLVGHRPNSWKPLKTLTAIAAKNGARLATTTLASLRENVDLYWRLERLRAACVIHMGEGVAMDAQIVARVSSSGSSRSRLHADFTAVHPQLIDARLGFLHCAGRLRLDFAGDDFGVALRQEKLS